MSSRWKKVWADFWGNKIRTVLMVLTITVGVFAVGFVGNMSVMVNRDMEADYQSANPAEAIIYTSWVDKDLVERLNTVPGVGGVEGRSTISVFVNLPDGRRINTQLESLTAFSDDRVNIIKPAEPGGTLPEIHEKEFWLDRSAALGLNPGDIVKIEMTDGTVRKLRFGGYVHSVAIFPYNIVSTASGYVTPETLFWLGGSADYFDQVIVSVAENPSDQKHVTTVAQAVGDRLKRADVYVGVIQIYNPGHHFAWDITQSIIFILGTLGWLTVLLGAILIINSITALVSQQTKQIGIMKAIGADTGQLLVMYLVLVLGLGVLALGISISLSGPSAYRIASGMARFLNFDSGPMANDRGVILQQVIVAIIVPLFAALFPILNNTRVSVREALSNYGIGNAPVKRKKDEDTSKGLVRLPRPMRISFRNAFRRRTRLVLTLIALVLGGGIFISVMNLWESFNRTIDDVGGYFLSDVNISFDRYHRFDKVDSIAKTVPGVVATEGWLGGGGKLFMEGDEDGANIVFNAPPEGSQMIHPIITEGRWLAPGDENALVIGNHMLNVRPELKVGDWVTLEIDDRKTKWEIVGIFRMPGNTAPPPVYVPYGYYAYLKGIEGQAYTLRIMTTQHDAESQAAIAKQIETVFRANGIPLSFVQTGAAWNAGQRASTDILAYFMLVMAILIAFVGGLGLMGTMSINVLERTREIGVMRAIGASNWDIQTIVIAEGAAIGLISWAFSMLLAIPLTAVLDVGVGTALLQAPIPYIFGLSGSLSWLIGILLIAAIASALPARNASRLTVKDTLAYE